VVAIYFVGVIVLVFLFGASSDGNEEAFDLWVSAVAIVFWPVWILLLPFALIYLFGAWVGGRK
jgi:hypothetical protein